MTACDAHRLADRLSVSPDAIREAPSHRVSMYRRTLRPTRSAADKPEDVHGCRRRDRRAWNGELLSIPPRLDRIDGDTLDAQVPMRLETTNVPPSANLPRRSL